MRIRTEEKTNDSSTLWIRNKGNLSFTHEKQWTNQWTNWNEWEEWEMRDLKCKQMRPFIILLCRLRHFFGTHWIGCVVFLEKKKQQQHHQSAVTCLCESVNASTSTHCSNRTCFFYWIEKTKAEVSHFKMLFVQIAISFCSMAFIFGAILPCRNLIFIQLSPVQLYLLYK